MIAIHQPEETMRKMDAWNQATHTKSGLVKRVAESEWTENAAEEKCLAFLKQHTVANTSPMCGNSICQDRRFLFKHLPKLEKYFHYRNLDVSSFKIILQRLRPDLLPGIVKTNTHQALQDIKESINELRYYYEYFLNLH